MKTRIAVLRTSLAFTFSKLGHYPTICIIIDLKVQSKVLVKKVFIYEEQYLRMGRVHIKKI